MPNIDEIREDVPVLKRKAGEDKHLVSTLAKNTIAGCGIGYYERHNHKDKGGGILYEYLCGKHGRFDGWANLDTRTVPKPCPKCKQLSERVISVVNHTWNDWVIDGLTHDVPRRRGIDEYVL